MGIATDAIAEGRVVETGIPAPLDRLPWSRWYGRRHHLFGKLVESGETSQVFWATCSAPC